MKKLLLYVFGIIFFCFLIPAVFTTKFSINQNGIENVEVSVVENEIPAEIIEYDYNEYSKINLLHKDTGNVEEVDLDQYLLGVVAAEMPADYEIEALKAQAMVARSYTLYKITKSKPHQEADICDSHLCCQAWISKEKRFERWDIGKREENWAKIVRAVSETGGKIITYNGEVIDAFFHANSGGVTEVPVNVWGGTNFPYLQAVATSGEDAYTQYSSNLELSKDDVISKIKETHGNIEIDWSNSECIKVIEYTESGRIKTIQFGNVNLSGVEARTIFSLKSANFKVTIGENVQFEVTGYGHGVGMSQTGANTLAKERKNM